MNLRLNPEKTLVLLGFAQKAGKVVSGDETVRAFLKQKKVKLLLVADDSNEKRQHSWSIEAEKANVPLAILSNKQQMGLAIGMSERIIVGVTDDAFAQAMMKYRME